MEGLKFAAMREDPEVEASLIRQAPIRSALVVASGGCSALTLKHAFPALNITAFDFNPVQLEHFRTKVSAVEAGELARLNVDDPLPTGLNQCGAFDGLFRILRQILIEFVAPAEEWERFFSGGPGNVERWFVSPYWPVAFRLAFDDSILHAMFGPAATQHAEPGSYPTYFQRVFERGLRAPNAARNPYLQHVLLGRYRSEDAPSYVGAQCRLDIQLVQGSLPDVPALERFDLFSLSNVFDWSDDALIETWCSRLRAEVRPGAIVLIRQLNNRKDLRPFLSPRFRFDDDRAAELWRLDRSLFYERLVVAVAQ